MIPRIAPVLIALALVAIASFAFGCKVGSAMRDGQILALQQNAQEAREKQLANIRLLEQEREAKEAAAAALEIERNKAAQVITKEVTRDVIRYVQKPSSQHCGIDSDGVRIINAAAAGRVSQDTQAPGTPDASAAAVVASVADNYITCKINANQLRALQDWARAL